MHFHDLPTEIVALCFSFVPPKDLWRHGLYVCHLWQEIIQSEKGGWLFQGKYDSIWIGIWTQRIANFKDDREGLQGYIIPTKLHEITTTNVAVFQHVFEDDFGVNSYEICLPGFPIWKRITQNFAPLLSYRQVKDGITVRCQPWRIRFERLDEHRSRAWLSIHLGHLAETLVRCSSSTDTTKEYPMVTGVTDIADRFFHAIDRLRRAKSPLFDAQK